MKRVVVLITLIAFSLNVLPQTSIPRAQAMFIYNFCRLIEWPAAYRTGPFVIGVLGSCPTLTELEVFMQGKNVGTQAVTIKKFEDPAEIDKCHILFVPYNKSKMLADANAKIGAASTLIITEKGGTFDDGSVINFSIIGDKLKFELMPSNATSRQIKISSKLNEMAYRVH